MKLLHNIHLCGKSINQELFLPFSHSRRHINLEKLKFYSLSAMLEMNGYVCRRIHSFFMDKSNNFHFPFSFSRYCDTYFIKYRQLRQNFDFVVLMGSYYQTKELTMFIIKIFPHDPYIDIVIFFYILLTINFWTKHIYN